jgi:hypothetical protein
VDDLESYRPERPDEFGFLLEAMAGPDDDDRGEESFDIVVCTPKWLIARYGKKDIIVARHHIIVFEYNYVNLRGFIEQYCDACQGSTWGEVAEKLSRLGHWEFEDYHP